MPQPCAKLAAAADPDSGRRRDLPSRRGARAPARGGSLPWDTPLTTLKNDLTGPVAFTISLLAMVACGAALVFGGEINEFVRRIIMLVLVCAFIVGVTNLASALGITGAIV